MTTTTTRTRSGLNRTFVYWVGAETASGWPLFCSRVDANVPVLTGYYVTKADAEAALAGVTA